MHFNFENANGGLLGRGLSPLNLLILHRSVAEVNPHRQILDARTAKFSSFSCSFREIWKNNRSRPLASLDPPLNNSCHVVTSLRRKNSRLLQTRPFHVQPQNKFFKQNPCIKSSSIHLFISDVHT